MPTEYTTTAKDMEAYLANWMNHPATPWQQLRYPQEHRLKHEQLGKDHPDALLLETDRHGDNEPVGEVQGSTALHYFWTGANNYRRPSDRFLARFARFMELPLERGLCLVLKGQFQRQFAEEAVGGNPRIEEPNGHTYECHRQEVERLCRVFVPGNQKNCLDTEGIFNLFEGMGNWVTHSGYDLNSFKALVDTIILHQVHLVANKGPLMDTFVATHRTQLERLNAVSLEKQDLFHRLNFRRLSLEAETGDQMFEREQLFLRLAKINQKWMKEFGDAYISLVEARKALLKVEKMLELKAYDPDLIRGELEFRVNEGIEKAEEQLKSIMEEMNMARMMGLPGIETMAPFELTKVGDKERNDYEQECKKVLREIDKRTHPDSTIHEKNFTREQNDKLKAYFEEAQSFKKRLCKYSGFDTLLDIVPLDKLKNTLALVEALWESAGIDFDEVRMVIRGETIEEQLTWLSQEVERLEEKIGAIRDEMRLVWEHPETTARIAALANEEGKRNTHGQLAARLAETQKELARREKELAHLLGENQGDEHEDDHLEVLS
ncbi:MAG: hypothetical protein H7829_02210 [Magnetococcus sp. THC-1_WYH]